MKKIYFILVTLLSLPTFGQIQQEVNKTSGTETNPITEIDSIRFNGSSTQMEIILTNGSVESHTISDINNVTFSGQLIGGVTSLDCAGATINGTLVAGIAASGVSADINYTGGNGGAHNGQVVTSTGVTGLTATLTAGNFASGAGTLTYTITGSPNSSGTASFAINIGGMSCTLSVNVGGGSISTLSCAGAIINGTLVEGVPASGVSAEINYTGGNGGTHNGQVVTSTGVTGLTATLTAGNFASGAGTLTYDITGTPSASGTASFAINIGGVSCALQITVNGGAVSTLNCAGATINGTLVEGVAASGVSADINYTGGNGGAHNGQVVTSTGVTGLTATLTAGNFASGAGTLTYTITGTPSASGTASFAINIGGMMCTLEITVDAATPTYPPGTVHCTGIPTAIIDVTNPTTGDTWMDRNLGASQVATSSTDVDSYGDLYQWGRGADGHQCRTSPTISTLSSTDQPGHGDFILSSTSPNDWRSPQNTNLWQGVNGVNNPCPSGYRLPTETEINAERLSWSANTSAGAFASPLRLPVAGFRTSSTGSLFNVGEYGRYWSSTVISTNSRNLYFNSSNAYMNTFNRGNGDSVRCIKD